MTDHKKVWWFLFLLSLLYAVGSLATWMNCVRIAALTERVVVLEK